MVKKEILDLVKFNPDEVRAAIQALMAEDAKLMRTHAEYLRLIEVYQHLLALHGIPQPEHPRSEASGDQPRTAQGSQARMYPEASTEWNRRLRERLAGPRIADVAVEVLRTSGAAMHGKDILRAVVERGLMKGVRAPMSNLVTALRREPRIEKDANKPNTWRLKVGVGRPRTGTAQASQ
jgi:hypothetical protein